jgi:hypothetical protein
MPDSLPPVFTSRCCKRVNRLFNAFRSGDELTGKSVLREMINATVAFEQRAADLRKPGKSLHRMLRARGNPTTANFFAILSAL